MKVKVSNIVCQMLFVCVKKTRFTLFVCLPPWLQWLHSSRNKKPLTGGARCYGPVETAINSAIVIVIIIIIIMII